MGLKIYTDGGCSGNPGPGGWAYIIIRDFTPDNLMYGHAAGVRPPRRPPVPAQTPEILVEKYGGEAYTTNNRMELTAALAALEALSALPSIDFRSQHIILLTDSQYLQKGMESWLNAWKRNAWRTSERKQVKNRDLWERLDQLRADLHIQWVWIKGHWGNEFNERCDRMTQQAIAALDQDAGIQQDLFPPH